MLVVSIRALILYLVVFATVRVMGKRELGQLQPYEFVIAIMMADLAATPMANTGVPIFHGVISILALLIIYLILSWLMLKNEKVRYAICGRPTVIISHGRILEHEMRRSRYTFSDLLEQTRENGIFALTDIEYAILETSGRLTVIPTQRNKPLSGKDTGLYCPQEPISYNLVLDGRLHRRNLLESGRTEEWLLAELAKQGYPGYRGVFLALLAPDGSLHVQASEKKGRWWGS